MRYCPTPCSIKSLKNVGTQTLALLNDHFGIQAIPESVLVVTWTDVVHHGRASGGVSENFDLFLIELKIPSKFI